MLDGSYFFECQCGSSEHILRFTLDASDEDPGIYSSVFLDSDVPWYKRLWMGIKYIFGYRCKYGYFGCWLMKDEDIERFQMMISKYQNMKNVNNSEQLLENQV